MIIGIATLFMMLFGVGNLDVFYTEKLEKGVNKYVEDKERKKQIQSLLKDYTSEVKSTKKERQARLKELKSKNAENNAARDWYEAFFKKRMEERKTFQQYMIEERLKFQEMIKEEEWKKIMADASSETSKLEMKEKHKEMKAKDKNIFKGLEMSLAEHINDKEKQKSSVAALQKFEESYEGVSTTLQNIDVNQTEVLKNQKASKQELLNFVNQINDQRKMLYDSYVNFYFEVRNNTQDEEWEPIVKEFNKLIE